MYLTIASLKGCDMLGLQCKSMHKLIQEGKKSDGMFCCRFVFTFVALKWSVGFIHAWRRGAFVL